MKKIISLGLILLISFSLCSCGTKETPNIDQMRAICELSTVKAYYNNVAKGTKEAGRNWWNILEKNREFWIEYDGVAEIGIDMEKVSMEIKKNKIIISIPDAELLSTRIVRETFDESCYITNSDSWWDNNKITTEDQQKAINEAQNTMRSKVQEDRTLFARAKNIAMETIQNYIYKINDATGSHFTIEWR